MRPTAPRRRRTAAAQRRAAAPKPRELGPLARMIAAEPVPPAISAVVLAGIIRLYEFVAIVGRRARDLSRLCACRTRLSLALLLRDRAAFRLATIASSSLADLYSVAPAPHARRAIEPRLGVVWTIGVPGRRRARFLRAAGGRFLPRLGRVLVRQRAAVALCRAVPAFGARAALDARRPARRAAP